MEKKTAAAFLSLFIGNVLTFSKTFSIFMLQVCSSSQKMYAKN